MEITCHSEYGKLKSVFLKKSANAFLSDQRLADEWELHCFLGKPDFEKAKEEYTEFEKLVTGQATVFHFSQDKNTTIDSIYCRDASIATDYGMILCNMGKPERRAEPMAQKIVFESHGIKILGEIRSPGTLEGGDVAWIDRRTLAVGHTYRTNIEGIRQLKSLLEPKGIEIIVVQLPHYKGPSNVFHLMSVFSPVDQQLAVVYSPLMPIAFRNLLVERGYGFAEVPDKEFESMGCNVLAIAPSHCVMMEGNPETRSALERAGCSVTTYPGTEISWKGGGGPTCLTRPWQREI